MQLTEIAKSRVRMHFGVPAIGLPQTGTILGFRFNPEVGTLEFRMINLQPFEAAQISGNPIALIQINGNPQVGDVVSVTIGTNAPITYTVTSADMAASIPLQSISQNWAQAITLANQGYLGDYGIPPQTKPFGFPGAYTGTVIIQPVPSGPNAATPFTITTTTSGNTIPYVAQQGVQVAPVVSFAESGVTVYGYLAICDYLEARIALSSDLQKYATTTGAGGSGVRLRPNELAERQNTYDYWAQRMADFFGISRYPMGRPAAPGEGRFTGAI